MPFYTKPNPFNQITRTQEKTLKNLLNLAALLAVFIALPAYAADEVIVSERGPQTYSTNGDVQPILGTRIATQSLTIGSTSSAFNGATSMIRICNNAGAPIWYKIGASNVSAAANTAGNEYLPEAACVDEPVNAGQYIDTAADS
jgi:hypothetical protein